MILLIVGLLAVFQGVREFEIETIGTLVALPWGLFLGSWPLVMVAAWYYKVSVYREGIRCYDGLGKYQNVTWASMRSFQRINRYTLPYLLVSSTHQREPFALPLYLSDIARFRDCVESLAGHNHELLNHLVA